MYETNSILSRLNIVHTLNENTPICVLEEIALCHNLTFSRNNYDINEFISNVTRYPVGVIHNPIINEDFLIISRYVNPEVDWSESQLQIAFDYLKEWETGNISIPNHFDYGLQTSFNPYSINACCLYKMCRYFDIPLNKNLSITDLAIICKIIKQGNSYGISILYNKITNIDKYALINIYTYYSNLQKEQYPMDEIHELNRLEGGSIDEITQQELTYDSIQECLTQFNNKQFLRGRINPKTYAEALVLAALNYRIDLSSAKNPIEEYYLLSGVNGELSKYTTKDYGIYEILQMNKYMLHLDYYFNPELPADLYDGDILTNMAKIEGFSRLDLDRESPYTLLQCAYMTSTFYHGKHLQMINEETPFYYDTVSNLDNEIVVCFGVKPQAELIAFRYGELSELFKNNKNFMNPITKEMFPDIAIKKLKNLSNTIKQWDTDEHIKERRSLYIAIINTELFCNETMEKMRQLVEIYNCIDIIKKNSIRDAILKLFYLSMYMRGWTGSGPYPIEKAPVDNQIEVDLLVTDGLIKFEEVCKDLGDIGGIIYELPLLKYQGSEFIASTDSRSGKTIGERIMIVKSGEDHDTYDSCIRLSSNLFAISSYRYMEILDMTLPFQIDKLREIS